MSIEDTVKELTEKKMRELDNMFAQEATNTVSKPAEPDPKASPLVHGDKLSTKGWVKWSAIFGAPMEDGTDPLVGPKPPKKSAWADQDAIPDADPNWIINEQLVLNVCRAILNGHNMFMFGKPGTGKTKAYREVAARLKMPYYRVTCNASMEYSDIFGQVHLEGGKTKWVDGPVMKAVRNGGILAIDEPFKLQANASMGFMWLCESDKTDRSVMLFGHPDVEQIRVKAHPDLRLVMADNVRGTGDNMDIYAGTELQDSAFINRMQYKEHCDYLPPELEAQAIAKRFEWISSTLALYMAKVAKLMRSAWDQGSVEVPFSFRELEIWSQAIYENGGNIHDALHIAYGNMLSTEEKDLLAKACRDVGL